MLGFQVGHLNRQHVRNADAFDDNVRRAVTSVRDTLLGELSHVSSMIDPSTYDTMYVNPDSTFVFMVAQSVQKYPLMPFQPDTLLPKVRLQQVLRFKEELEASRQRKHPDLQEFYIFRAIQACLPCERDQRSVAQLFPLDSLIRHQLKDKKMETQVQIAFYDKAKKAYTLLAKGDNQSALDSTRYQFDVLGQEQVRLYFPHRQRALIQLLVLPGLGSLVLIGIPLISFWLALRLILRQKKLSELKSDFINNVTHEFKTPIATIAFAVANVENELVIHHPESIRQFTKVIKEENKRLNLQVEQVLQAALLDGKAMEMKQEPINIHLLINELADAYELKLSNRGHLARKLNAARALATGDLFHLSNVLSNLLDNAIKYTRETAQITISTENQGNGIWIRVADRGIGISKENQAHVFEKFYRVPSGNVHNVKGFGLGLSYVKDIVEQHRGQVGVQSRLGQGSVFSIFLPFGAS